ncbi:MAG: helix-turn-helix domain-containing protein [Euryarchaeota archaeon]|nr:helix-turn-helix domain-containing protein [Euryarchaeota archaeon]
MQLPRRILYGLVGAVLLGVMLSTVSVSQTIEPVPPLTIPTMHVGDRLLYDVYGTGDGDVAGFGIYVHSVVYEVGALGTTLDHTGTPVPTVGLRAQYEDWMVEYQVSLLDRYSVTRNISGEMLGTALQPTVYDRAVPALPGLALQGTILRVDDEFQVPLRFDGTSRGFGAGAGAGALHLSTGSIYLHTPPNIRLDAAPHLQPPLPEMATATVLGEGTFDGTRVMGVSWTSSDEAARRTITDHDDVYVIPGYRSTTTTTQWWSEGAPAPLLVRSATHTILDNGTERDSVRTLVLKEYAPAEVPVPWRSSAPPAPPLEKGRSLGFRPVDGTGAALPYPLSQAVEDAFGPHADAEWHAWTLNHPKHDLVGAMMNPGSQSGTSGETFEWRLLFWDAGEAYEVRVERGPGLPATIVEGMGTADVQDRTDWPAKGVETITIAGMERLWRAAFGHGIDVRPDHFQWGVEPDRWRSSSLCVIGVSSRSDRDDGSGDAVRTARIGRAAHGPCRSDEAITRFESLYLRIDTPTLLSRVVMVSDWSQGSPWGDRDGEPAGAVVAAPSSASDIGVSFGMPDPVKATAVTVPLVVFLFAAYFFPALKFAVVQGFLLFPGFSRLKRDRILESEQREQLHTIIANEPGAPVSRLVKETGMGWGTTVHHLTVMEQHGLVCSLVEGRHRRFFLPEHVAVSERPHAALLANERTGRFYEALIEEPGLAAPDLAERIGVTVPGAHYQLQRLHGSGLVERRRDGRKIRYYPVDREGPPPYDPKSAVEVA